MDAVLEKVLADMTTAHERFRRTAGMVSSEHTDDRGRKHKSTLGFHLVKVDIPLSAPRANHYEFTVLDESITHQGRKRTSLISLCLTPEKVAGLCAKLLAGLEEMKVDSESG